MKFTRQNCKLKHTIVISIILHFFLISILIYISINQPKEARYNSSSINAVMVNPSIVQQHYSQQTQQADTLSSSKLREKEAAQQDESTTKQASTDTKQQTNLRIKQDNNYPAQKQVDVKVRKAVKIKIVHETKQQGTKKATIETKSEQILKDKEVTFNKKIIIDEKKKVIATNNLSNITNAKKTTKLNSILENMDKSHQNIVTNVAITAYTARVSAAIQLKFYDAQSYLGKHCCLHIKLGSSGELLLVSAVTGDHNLCQAAVSAVKLADIPLPPTQQLYEIFKDVELKFSPK